MWGCGMKLWGTLLDPMASFSETFDESSGFSNLKFEDNANRRKNSTYRGLAWIKFEDNADRRKNSTYRGLAWIKISGIIQRLFFMLSAVNLRINETLNYHPNCRLQTYSGKCIYRIRQKMYTHFNERKLYVA